jgi:cytochrome c biogenesis protein CcdA
MDKTRYLFLVIAVLLLALVGYAGYVLYPRFDLPAVSGAGLLLLAAAAGVASFFSPCSFPLLATLLARQARDVERRVAWARLLRFGLALASGAALFLLITGAAIALGAAPLFAGMTFTSTAGRLLRLAAGSLLVGHLARK